MNVNKKLDVFKRWAGERMGGEVKTNVSEDFRALETEMGLRHQGMEKLQKSMNQYVKSISKRSETEEKDKNLPIGYLGKVMVSHGEDFEDSSEFGQSLICFGRTQEKLGRIQDSYVVNATSSWLESSDRSIAQMKEYQAARKKLETRRLAYDTSLTKLERQKKEDFRVEEELRNARAKFDETSDDVYRRMQDIKEAEGESVKDLEMFLQAQLEYHDKCREALLSLKREWPASSQISQPGNSRPLPRSRANTGANNPYTQRYSPADDASPPPSPEPEQRPAIRSNRPVASRVNSGSTSGSYARPGVGRSSTFEVASQRRDASPLANGPRLARIPTSDSLTIRTQRSQLRNANPAPERDVFDDQAESYGSSSPEHSYGDPTISPATSHGSGVVLRAKGPPPPPPSRAKKPPPPPPPAKRTVFS